MLTFLFNKKIIRDIGIIFILPWIFNGFLLLEAHSHGLPKPLLPSTHVTSDESAKATDQIFIELPETNLCDALDQLARKSGIRFNCPEKLEDHFVYARTLVGPNWGSVAQEFLEDYNTLAIYNEAGQATKFYLLGSKGQAPPALSQPTSKPQPTIKPDFKQEAQPSKTSGLPGSNLNRSQLFALLKTSTFKPFPQHFFNISDFEEILNFAGIKTPEDWMVVEKSRTLKKQIQKLLKK